MPRYVPSFCLLFSLLALTGLGCQPTGPTLGGSTSAPVSSGASASACDHAYYPLRAGYQISYRSSGTPDNAYSFRVTDVGNNRASLLTSYPRGLTSTQTIDCSADGLRLQSNAELGSLFPGGQAQITTLRSDGWFLPSDLHVGSVWDNSFDIKVQLRGRSAAADAINNATWQIRSHHQAMDEETVTVPAGTFTAIKVINQTQITPADGSGGALAGLGALPPINTMEWWVRGKGRVRSELQGSRGSTIVSEAMSIATP